MNSDKADPCIADFAEHTRHLFVDVAQASDIAKGARPARRAVFRKTHGIASARMILDPSRPYEVRAGIFIGDAYDLWVRFSSDVAPDSDDAENGTIGIGMKLFGVSPPSLAAIDPNAPTADILLQNHDVFFVDTGHDMCVFTDLALKGRIDDWFKDHPETKQILVDMAKHEESVLTATYWSVLPYDCGSAGPVKYRLRPLQAEPSRAPADDPNRLRKDLAERLLAGTAAFSFDIQMPKAGTTLPTDRATMRWEEADAPFLSIGCIEFPRQDIRAEGQASYGDNLTFAPWRVPVANQPLGSIAESRRSAYPSSAAARHFVNGVPDSEPHEPRRA
ncbi:hypothetical protein [Bradyrhizobium sp. LMG 9283]|uniref:hypothetical protein n=1 Tax=Bradyrhizobium sp. LMG 9283 TaxID=592064 RepID=UPI003890512C